MSLIPAAQTEAGCEIVAEAVEAVEKVAVADSEAEVAVAAEADVGVLAAVSTGESAAALGDGWPLG